MAQFKFVQWLTHWLQEISGLQFEWDEGNSFKSPAKHGISPEETEEVFLLRQAAPLGVQISPEAPEERLGIIGPNYSGRILQVVFTLRGGKIRPISARPAGRKERRLYEAYLREVAKGV